MNTVTVTASKNYEIRIGRDLLPQIGKYLDTIKSAGKTAILSDSHVWPLYGKIVEQSLINAGFQPIHYVIPAGEASKNIDTYYRIVNFLAEKRLTRSDTVIALGGGVVGDMAGFVSATYLRGIDYIQLPTSLLAMVDSSVGGKTAIDLPSGKNLVGAFYQPRLVLCDICALSTLPDSVFRDGCAEVIKYGILYDTQLFSHLEEHGLNFDKAYVVTRCVELKRDVVNADEFDRGARQKLNLGHTIGHGVEAYSNFSVSHGNAVAIGTAVITRAAVKLGLCPATDCERVLRVLEQFSLPCTTNYTPEQLAQCALSDKKRSGDVVNLIIPVTVGSCIIEPTPIAELHSIIKAGL